MSFLIVYKGQFSPFIHLTQALQGGVKAVSPLTNTKELTEFDEVLEQTQDEVKKKQIQHKLGAYKQATKSFEEHRKRQYARDIMTFPVKTISQGAAASEALDLLRNHSFRHLPVIDENNTIVGMITDKQINQTDLNKSCIDIMTERTIVAEEQASINEIAIILLREKINALPIVNHNRELSGIITLSDILKFVIESTPFLGKA